MHMALRELCENCVNPLIYMKRGYESASIYRMKKIIGTCANCMQSEIRTINFADLVDKACHDRMVVLFTQMLDLNKRLQDTKLEHEKTLLSRQVEAVDGAIDTLMYELYGLTGEEIKIIEG